MIYGRHKKEVLACPHMLIIVKNFRLIIRHFYDKRGSLSRLFQPFCVECSQSYVRHPVLGERRWYILTPTNFGSYYPWNGEAVCPFYTRKNAVKLRKI